MQEKIATCRSSVKYLSIDVFITFVGCRNIKEKTAHIDNAHLTTSSGLDSQEKGYSFSS